MTEMRTENTSTSTTTNRWNASAYTQDFQFVAAMARGVVEWLEPAVGERILDLGCGDGAMFPALSADGAEVVGVDASAAMVQQARLLHPDVDVQQGDACDLGPYRGFDAVFSNATLHWVSDSERAARSIRAALREGGRFVAEFGGLGNVTSIRDALRAALEARGVPSAPDLGWYFPSVGEYAAVLERAGFRVDRAVLFARPTPLQGGDEGLERWLRMFGTRWWPALGGEQDVVGLIRDVETACRDALFDGETWTADYVRIRVAATAV